VGMGILPLQFLEGENADSLGLTGRETYDITGLNEALSGDYSAGRTIEVTATREDGSQVRFRARIRIDTPQEVLYYRHGGILQYVLRQLIKAEPVPA